MMEEGRREIRRITFDKHKPWLLLAYDALDAARLHFSVLGPIKDTDMTLLQHTVAYLYLRAFRAASASLVLFQDGFGPEAFVTVRTLFEHLVDARYLQKYPDRTQDFWDYTHVANHKYYENMMKQFPKVKVPADLLNAITSKYEEIKGRYKKKSTWAPENIFERAKQVGLENAYHNVFEPASQHVHTNPMPYKKLFVEEGDVINAGIMYQVPQEPDCVVFMITLLMEAAEAFDCAFDLHLERLRQGVLLGFKSLVKG